MTRNLRVGGAQMGPIQKAENREAVVARMLKLMDQALAEGCDLVVYPELTLTTFFPRWYAEDEAEFDLWFEREMPNAATQPLFERARDAGIGICLGYAELTEEAGEVHRYNTSILVDKSGRIVGKYRKVHLPGHSEYDPERKWQHLEKRYFEPGSARFIPNQTVSNPQRLNVGSATDRNSQRLESGPAAILNCVLRSRLNDTDPSAAI